jgi:hypothetical protein
MQKDFYKKIVRLDDGAYNVSFQKKRYLLSKKTHFEGKLIKLYAEELGGNDFISLNYYPEIKEGLLKPCEMPVQKVVDFILELELFS